MPNREFSASEDLPDEMGHDMSCSSGSNIVVRSGPEIATRVPLPSAKRKVAFPKAYGAMNLPCSLFHATVQLAGIVAVWFVRLLWD
jgi:hypothetical protein